MALDARAISAQVLGQVIAGRSLNQVLPGELLKVPDKDRGLVQQLCYGTLRAYPRLKAVLDQLLDKPLRAKDKDVLALILIGLYQLEAMRVPDHAAVAATVGASRALGKPWAKGLANAILRRYLRERETLILELDEAARQAHPNWLFDKVHQQWPTDAEAILKANNTQPPMSLRINTQRTTRDRYLAILREASIDAMASPWAQEGIRLLRAVDVSMLPGFAEGDISVQDEAAQMAAHFLGAAPGDFILDACAAPGGKACHILELQPKLRELIASDIDGRRLEKVEENLQRLGHRARVEIQDASSPEGKFPAETFDRILVDAPCSASGVIRRNPDVKILRRPEDIDQFASQQLEILEGLWPLLKKGGVLLYATCSIFTEENSQVVEKFLQQHAEASCEVPKADWGEATPHGRQLLPVHDGPDGLFYALLSKASPCSG